MRRPRDRACPHEGGGGTGPIPSAPVGRLVPAHHLGDAGSRLSDGDQISLAGTERKRGHYGPDEELIPITAPEVRRLLTPPVWTESQPADFILYWSWSRRRTKPEPADATTIAVYPMCDCSTKTATISLPPASRGCHAGPLPPAALVVPGHRTPSGCLALRVTGRHSR